MSEADNLGMRPTTATNNERLLGTLEWIEARPKKSQKRRRLRAATVYDRIAVIIGKTYVERGDNARLPDDVALMLIRDLLVKIDGTIMVRNKSRSLNIMKGKPPVR